MKKKLTLILSIVAALMLFAAAIFSIFQDTSPKRPQILFKDETIALSITATDEELLKGVTAIDPEDGDVTNSIIVEGTSALIKGQYIKVNYAAFDSKNHVGKASRTIKFEDYQSPHFSMSGPLVFNMNSNGIDLLENVGAKDVFEGDISGRVKYAIKNGAAFTQEGEYEVDLTVTNKIGDTVTLPIKVKLTDGDPNPGGIILTKYLVYIKQGDSFNPKKYVKYWGNGKYKTSSTKGLTIKSTVDPKKAGVYKVDYSFTTVGGTKSMTRLYVVVE